MKKPIDANSKKRVQLGKPFSVLRSPFSVLRSPFSVLRSPFSVLRSPLNLKKKLLNAALIAAVLALTLTGCPDPKPDPTTVPVTGVTLDKAALSLNVNGTEKLTATIAPDNATNKAVTWSSSDTAKATVADDGTVTAKAEGTATITVTTADGGKTNTCTVTVTDGNGSTFIAVTSITGVPTTGTVNQELTLSGTVNPSTATNKTIAWTIKEQGGTSSTLSNTNKLTATNSGKVKVTATITNGKTETTDYTQDFEITIQSAGITGTAPTITTTFLPNGTIGTAYNQTLEADGDKPVTWSVKNGTLPANLNLNTTTGAITGNPTTADTFNFTLTAANTTGSDDKQFSITIQSAGITGTAPTITTTLLPNGTVGTAYNQTLTADGDTPITWSVKSGTSLPAGLSLNTTTGAITGNPTTATTYTFTVTATNTTGSYDKELSITIVAAGTTPITTYYVKYNANAADATGDMANSTHTVGEAKTLSPIGFTRTGYLFIGWTTNEDGTGTGYYNSQSVTNLSSTPGATVNLYAKWEEGNMFYGVVPIATLNYLKGTNQAAVGGWNNALGAPGAPGAPTANSHAHITTISTSNNTTNAKQITFSGNNYWFILVPKSLGNATILDAAGQNVTSANAKDSASLNGVEYWLHASTSSGSRDGLTLKIGY